MFHTLHVLHLLIQDSRQVCRTCHLKERIVQEHLRLSQVFPAKAGHLGCVKLAQERNGTSLRGRQVFLRSKLRHNRCHEGLVFTFAHGIRNYFDIRCHRCSDGRVSLNGFFRLLQQAVLRRKILFASLVQHLLDSRHVCWRDIPKRRLGKTPCPVALVQDVGVRRRGSSISRRGCVSRLVNLTDVEGIKRLLVPAKLYKHLRRCGLQWVCGLRVLEADLVRNLV